MFLSDSLLTFAMYGSLRRTKNGAARRSYEYVGVKGGEICGHKLNGSNIVVIRSDLDLERLE